MKDIQALLFIPRSSYFLTLHSVQNPIWLQKCHSYLPSFRHFNTGILVETEARRSSGHR
jgi:hypothetical protein